MGFCELGAGQMFWLPGLGQNWQDGGENSLLRSLRPQQEFLATSANIRAGLRMITVLCSSY